MLDALLAWMDPEQLFTLLQDQGPLPNDEARPMARPPALPDQIILKKMVPEDLYRDALRSGWTGMHALSFALRHRVTALQLLFHPTLPCDDPDLRQSLAESWERRHGDRSWPIFGFSPLGLHITARTRGLCRAFDAFTLWTCPAPASGIFCEEHATEAFWMPSKEASQQAIMFRYYADLQNFAEYGEADLQDMLGAFWKRYRNVTSEDLRPALEYFGFTDAAALRAAGPLQLRRRFLQLSFMHHPDRGGDAARFVRLQSHYQRLKQYLEAI